MVWEYSEKTRELFMDAVSGAPGTHLGEIDDPDGFGEHGSIACGDALRFTFRVRRDPEDPAKDVITEARYLTFGCTSAIASSEALCAIIEQGGYTPIEALRVGNDDIVNYLGGLPAQKIHCSVMGAEALEAAVYNWAQKRGVDLKAHGIEIADHTENEGRVVCKCFSITEPYIKAKIKELQLKTIPEVTNAIKAGGACMTCHHAPGGLQDLLDEAWGRQGTTIKERPDQPATHKLRHKGNGNGNGNGKSTSNGNGISPYQFSKKVEKLIDDYVRPMLQQDGGDIEIIDIKDRIVYAHLVGACASCAGAAMTLKMMVEQTLKNQIDDQIRVIAV